jgi:hypothetical protein
VLELLHEVLQLRNRGDVLDEQLRVGVGVDEAAEPGIKVEPDTVVAEPLEDLEDQPVELQVGVQLQDLDQSLCEVLVEGRALEGPVAEQTVAELQTLEQILLDLGLRAADFVQSDTLNLFRVRFSRS